MKDIKAALQAEIENMESFRDEIPFGLCEEDETLLSALRGAAEALVQRDAQIAALTADFIRLDRQMSVLEQTGIADRDRAQKAEAQLARYSMSAGEADQRASESRAVRNALGFCEEADYVAPCDLVDAINAMRAAPPAPVVVNEVLHTATAAIYFDDSSDFGPALWSIVRAINPEIAELLEKDSSAAFNKTAQLSSCNREAQQNENDK